MLENLNAVCGMILVLHLWLIYWWRTNWYSTITYLLPKLVLQNSITGPGLVTWLELPESSINPFRQGLISFLRSHLRHTLPTKLSKSSTRLLHPHIFEMYPKEFQFFPAAPTKIFHFTHQANQDQSIQPDPCHGLNVKKIIRAGCATHRNYHVGFHFKNKPQ